MKKKITTTTTVTEEIIDETPKPKKTYIALVLDRSSSMMSIYDQTISGFNENLDAIKANADLAGETFVSLVTFGGGYSSENAIEVVYTNKRIAAVKPISRQTYKPNGGTPMLDGLGLAIELLEPFQNEDEDIAFLVVTFSDGEENQSKIWTGPKLANKIKALEETGIWTIPLANANVDLKQLGAMTGSSQVAGFNASRVGTQVMFSNSAASVGSYMGTRGLGGTQSNFYAGNVNLSDTVSLKVAQDAAQSILDEARTKKAKKQLADMVTPIA